MYLLIETTTDNFTLAVGDGKTVSDFTTIYGKRKSENIVEELVNFLKTAGLTFHHLKAVGAGTGPGSFTGIRIGAACAITVSQVMEIPLYGISSMDIAGKYAANPALYAFRDNYYTADYNIEGNRISEYRVISLAEKNKTKAEEYFINHNELLEEIGKRYSPHDTGNWKYFEPVYVMSRPFLSLEDRNIRIGV